MAKLAASEAACKAADDGIQILGGYGFMMDFDMQRYWRDVRPLRTGPVSNEMARNFIAESQGLPRSY
jgi:alkylation response protein AidB-like acyl-CoA dehydrogenase